MQKGNSFDGSPIQYSKDGTPITLSEEDIRQRFPWTYKDVIGKARQRYADFKQNRQFNKVMAELKAEGKLCFERHLDSHNPKSQRQMFYSTNVWQKLDVIYTKRTK